MTDESFHNIGIKDDDPGRGKIINDNGLTNTFKTPGLRNVAFTAPYMHNGTFETLEEVILFYVKGGEGKEKIDKQIKPLNLNKKEIADLIAFMHALSQPLDVTKPEIP